MNEENNVFPTEFKIRQYDRAKLLEQQPLLIWFTGLSGSGKSTLANATEFALHQKGLKTYLLDGDNLRSGLNKGLGFSSEDRIENLRRVGEVSKLMLDAGLIVIAAFISPFRKEREMIKELVGKENFIEIHVSCPLEVCEKRDTKGLYQKARKGIIKDFTGIDSPYEAPIEADLKVDTDSKTVEECINNIVSAIGKRCQSYGHNIS
ncbi:adenylyl-sulfate kinase [Echinicola strongylocentroti]|uniref:Adenylyl-sulfate kinase n=1 Tax=Echinicola strongylocentroti TaxID=1795355 RepID=A0A2Z4IMC9_9BACT|nr:adenylyl-sulfate kinase [Echinicola strongylocentroti]AWW32055.1 adenylyl-sulfate kinase [Echinicola strongylocentroti]